VVSAATLLSRWKSFVSEFQRLLIVRELSTRSGSSFTVAARLSTTERAAMNNLWKTDF
jgi:hypothetical protein